MRFFLALCCLWPVYAMPGEQPVEVQVSIEPLRFFVERVGGERVRVGVVVEAGRAPETYDPGPRQIAALSDARVFFGVGMPLEAAWRRQLRAPDSGGPEWVDLSQGADAVESHADGGHDAEPAPHRHDQGDDPHLWLDPLRAERMVSDIAEVLARLDPGDAALYRGNAGRLRTELESLHQELSGLLAGSGVDTFLVYHPAWGHFARTFGLRQLAIETEGKEPGPRGLADVIAEARQAGVRVVFVNPRRGRRLAQTVAEAVGARLEVLDPLAYDYFENLRAAARAIAASGQ